MIRLTRKQLRRIVENVAGGPSEKLREASRLLDEAVQEMLESADEDQADAIHDAWERAGDAIGELSM